MSTFSVDVVLVESLEKHPNADSLDIVNVGGWQVVVKSGTISVGDKAIYVPVDAMLPKDLAKRWGIENYLGASRRVLTAKLRGEYSFGFLVNDDPILLNAKVGEDVSKILGITKYEPKNIDHSIACVEFPGFHRYTGIDNYENNRDLFNDGERVVITEKIHGTNSRIGKVHVIPNEPQFVFGTFKNQLLDEVDQNYKAAKLLHYKYVTNFKLYYKNIFAMIDHLYFSHRAQSVILFGEICGRKINNFPYNGKDGIGYMAFDIAINGRYLDYPDFCGACDFFEVPRVPLLDLCDFNDGIVNFHCTGETTRGNGFIREGIVIKPWKERLEGNKRVISKKINPDFRLNAHKIIDSH